MTEKRCICLQLEEYIADNMIELCEKRGISKAAASALYGTILQGSVTRLEKYAACAYAHFLDVTLSQFFCEGDPDDLTQPQSEVLAIWNDLSVQEQEVVLAMLRGLQKR